MNKRIYTEPIWWLLDYENHLMLVLWSLKGSKPNYPIDIWRKQKVKNLEEHYYAGLLRSQKIKNPDPSEYFKKMVEGKIAKKDIKLFWEKKKRLDELIILLNEGFGKQELDMNALKKIFNEISLIIFTTESVSRYHTPFPEVMHETKSQG